MTITNQSVGASYSMTNAKPGDTSSKCFTVTYNGSLPANVKVYRGTLSGTGLEGDTLVTIQEGTGTASDCSNFVQSGATLYSGTLSAMGSSWATGYSVLNRAGSTTWTNVGPNNVVTFKIQAQLDSNTPSADQGKSTGTHSFIWEAQNT